MKKYTIVKRLVMFALLSHLLPESTAQLSTDGFDSLIVVKQKKKALIDTVSILQALSGG